MKKNMQKEGVGSLLCGHRVDQKSLDQEEPDGSGQVTQRQQGRSPSQVFKHILVKVG